ncbi:MAG: hypothetical protein WC632_06010 [Candidatus Margulisiibacteriota bacterium]
MKKTICLFVLIILALNIIFSGAALALDMQYGQLKVLSKGPACYVFVDEEKSGETPLFLEEVVAGSHSIRAVETKSLKTKYEKLVVIKSGELTTIMVDDENYSPSTNQYYSGSSDRMLSNLSLYSSEKKDPGISALLSFLIIGGGQVVNGNWPKAIGSWVIAIASYSGMTAKSYNYYGTSTNNSSGTWALVYIANWFYWTYDAYADADDQNKKLKIKYGISSFNQLEDNTIKISLYNTTW